MGELSRYEVNRLPRKARRELEQLGGDTTIERAYQVRQFLLDQDKLESGARLTKRAQDHFSEIHDRGTALANGEAGKEMGLRKLEEVFLMGSANIIYRHMDQ